MTSAGRNQERDGGTRELLFGILRRALFTLIGVMVLLYLTSSCTWVEVLHSHNGQTDHTLQRYVHNKILNLISHHRFGPLYSDYQDLGTVLGVPALMTRYRCLAQPQLAHQAQTNTQLVLVREFYLIQWPEEEELFNVEFGRCHTVFFKGGVYHP